MSDAERVSLLVFAAFAFFGIVLPWLGRRQGKWQQKLPPRDDAARPLPGQAPDEALEDQLFEDDLFDEVDADAPVVWSPPPRPAAPVPTPRPLPPVPRQAQAPRAAGPRGLPETPRVQSPRAALIGDRADARRGIKLITVLGPCRAFDPY